MSATGYTPISLYYSTTASAVPVNTNLANGELAINITDGKLYYKNNSGVVTLLASSSGASGDVVGPASATDTAVALFDGTTGKLIKNSLVTIGSTGNTVIAGTDNTNAMLRITQLGTGNALLVEDSANPDSTPFVIDSNGRVIVGNTTATGSYAFGTNGQLQMQNAYGVFSQYSANTSGNVLDFVKSRSATIGTQTIVQSGDVLGGFYASGSDGAAFIPAAQILASVDGTPGTNDMPGRLVFSTTADGASSPTERMRIDSAGRVGIGSSPASSNLLTLGGTNPSTSADTIVSNITGYTIPSTSTTSARGYFTQGISTQATAFTLTSLRHFEAGSVTIGSGSTVTEQVGFRASALTGATNNYGFRGAVALASNSWNIYMDGTADNYVAGALGIGSTSLTGYSLRVGKNITGAVASVGIASSGIVQSDVTSNAQGFRSAIGTAATAFTLPSLYQYIATQGTIGAGSTVTTQYGYYADSTITGATNNYGFYGNIASGTGRYNFYANGTADNYFAGNVGIGTSSPGAKLAVVGTAYSPNITLTDAATIAWDTSTGQVATFTFVTSSRTMGAPTNLVNGGFYALAVIQNSGSNTLSWNAVFKWAGGTAPTLSTAAGAKDYFVFRSDGTNLYQQGISQAVA